MSNVGVDDVLTDSQLAPSMDPELVELIKNLYDRAATSRSAERGRFSQFTVTVDRNGAISVQIDDFAEWVGAAGLLADHVGPRYGIFEGQRLSVQDVRRRLANEPLEMDAPRSSTLNPIGADDVLNDTQLAPSMDSQLVALIAELYELAKTSRTTQEGSFGQCRIAVDRHGAIGVETDDFAEWVHAAGLLARYVGPRHGIVDGKTVSVEQLTQHIDREDPVPIPKTSTAKGSLDDRLLAAAAAEDPTKLARLSTLLAFNPRSAAGFRFRRHMADLAHQRGLKDKELQRVLETSDLVWKVSMKRSVFFILFAVAIAIVATVTHPNGAAVLVLSLLLVAALAVCAMAPIRGSS